MYYNQPTNWTARVLDAIASHPGCARFIAQAVPPRFVVDEPSSTLVNTIANLFQSTWRASDQLRQVTQAILLSTEFKQSWGGKMKRPANAFVSALRAGADFTPRPDNTTTTYTPTEELLRPHPGGGAPPVLLAGTERLPRPPAGLEQQRSPRHDLAPARACPKSTRTTPTTAASRC